METLMIIFIVIITLVVVLCLLIFALLFYILRVRKCRGKSQSYPVTESVSQSTNNPRKKSQIVNISQSGHISSNISPSSNNIQLKNYRRFFDEPMVVVNDDGSSEINEKRRPTSFSNEAYAISDPEICSSDFPVDFNDQISITYLPDDFFALQLDRSQKLLTDSRRNLVSEQVLANSVSQHKLRRELAEVIAKDKVLENTVTFTDPIFSGDVNIFDHQQSFLRERSTNSSYKSDSNDLEVVFRERTAV